MTDAVVFLGRTVLPNHLQLLYVFDKSLTQHSNSALYFTMWIITSVSRKSSTDWIPGSFCPTKYLKREYKNNLCNLFEIEIEIWGILLKQQYVIVRSWACRLLSLSVADKIRWIDDQKHKLCSQSQHLNLLFISTWKHLLASTHTHTHKHTAVLHTAEYTHWETGWKPQMQRLNEYSLTFCSVSV